MTSAFSRQIQNRNFLTPSGFEFIIAKNPKIDFFCQTANIPEIRLGTAIQPSYLKNLDIPGEILEYTDFEMSFLVDEDFENYMAVHNWMTGLGFPETPQQFKDLVTNNDNIEDYQEQFSDGTLIVLNSNLRPNFKIKFRDMFPVSLSGLEFDSKIQSEQYFTARAVFKYSIYEVTNMLGIDL